MFEAVIFDWDGTIADTRKAILIAFRRTLLDLGLNVSDEQIDRRIGIGAAETFREILSVEGKLFNETLIRELVERKIQAEIEVSSETHLFDGALELLSCLRNKVKLGLASMKNRKLIEHLLRTTHTEGYFEVVLTADEVDKHKPDPEIYVKTAQQLGIVPNRCVVVEDSVFGVQAAKAAKMHCIAVVQGAFSREELTKSGADLVVSSLREQYAILQFILK